MMCEIYHGYMVCIICVCICVEGGSQKQNPEPHTNQTIFLNYILVPGSRIVFHEIYPIFIRHIYSEEERKKEGEFHKDEAATKLSREWYVWSTAAV